MLTIVMINRWKKGFFFFTSMSIVGLSNCWSFCHLCQRTTYAGYDPVEFVASKHFHFRHKSCLLLLVDCAYLSEHTCHVHLSRPLPSSHLLSWTDTCHVSVVCLVMSCGIPFLLVCTVPQQLIFCLVRWSDKSGEEQKLSVYSECPCPFTFFLSSTLL
jgi:hypothetical protein